MDQALILRRVAYDVDDEASPLHVKRQRLGQRQGGRPGNDDDLGTPAIPGALRPPRFPQPAAFLIALEDDGAADDDDDTRQDLVPSDPILDPFEARHGDDGDGRPGRRARANRVGDPFRPGERLADDIGGAVDVVVDEVGDVVGVLAEVDGDARELEGRGRSSGQSCRA